MVTALLILLALGFIAGVLLTWAFTGGQVSEHQARDEHVRAMRAAKRLHDIAQEASHAMYEEATRCPRSNKR